MDKIIKYQKIISDILQTYKARFERSNNEVKPIIIIDKEQNQFQFLWKGWNRGQYVFSVSIHISMNGEKIWVDRDITEIGVANLLVEAGIPNSDIVLGYFDPDHRKLTDFAA
ncbi:MAG: XisI protein [Bacteroidetes bacterium]|nr:XisI protein [Bacteroidota bacterium]MCB0839817.1 XisI protein [Bacteroidota bacterium]MCB0855759.1 XisI protein [Bacteroidota bacterium]